MPTKAHSAWATAMPLPTPTILRFWLTLAPQRLEMTRENASEASSMTYDPNNVFAKVLRGELPAHKIYEDEDTLAFLDIMPRAEGHALVITKEKARDLFDVSPQALAKLMAVVQKLEPADQGGGGRRRRADRAVQRRGRRPDRVPPPRPHHPAQRGHGAEAPRRHHGRSGATRRHRREDPEEARDGARIQYSHGSRRRLRHATCLRRRYGGHGAARLCPPYGSPKKSARAERHLGHGA